METQGEKSTPPPPQAARSVCLCVSVWRVQQLPASSKVVLFDDCRFYPKLGIPESVILHLAVTYDLCSQGPRSMISSYVA